MILTVTLNPALDLTYAVPRLVEHGSHRVRVHGARAGGKGLNVARVLHDNGEPTLATGILGGGSVAVEIVTELTTGGIPHRFSACAGDARRSVNVVASDTGDATIFNEPGPAVEESDWRSFLRLYDDLLAEASLVVCSGSLPPGLAATAYAELVGRAGPTPVIVDATGPALVAAAVAGATIVKPNLAEARATTGEDDPVLAARSLMGAGAGATVVSLGADGLLAVTRDGGWRARSRERLAGNPTGAGDACVAALAVATVAGAPWPDRLRAAVACSAGAVVAPLAGDVDESTRARILRSVHLEDIHAPRTHR